ncbi:MAG: tandem-95 repeat protein [Mariniphaga sp.]|nr:tandem-95 repeat protein [Mariniphaga sp.]
MKLLLTNLFLLFCFIGSAQKSELTINILDEEYKAVKGLMEVYGNDSYFSDTLINGSVYFLLKNQTTVIDFNLPDVNLFPNPLNTEYLVLSLRNWQNDYNIRFFSIDGKMVGELTGIENFERIQVQTGVLIVTIQNSEGHLKTKKLINNVGSFYVLTNETNDALKSFSSEEDKYFLYYSDPDLKYQSISDSLLVPLGTHKTINWVAIPINTAPELDDIPDISTIEDLPITGVDLDEYLRDDFTSIENIIKTVEIENPDLVNVYINENNQIIHEPKPNQYGTTNITVTGEDEEGLKTSKTYQLTIVPENDLPILQEIADITFNEDEGPVIGPQIVGKDIESPKEQLNLTAQSDNPDIQVSIDEAWIPTYTSTQDKFGKANLCWIISDPEGGKDTLNSKVIVNSTDDNPVAIDDYLSTPFNTSITFNPTDNDTHNDNDKDATSGYVTVNSTKGTITILNGEFTYKPNQSISGIDSLSYQLKDLKQNPSNTGKVYFTIEDQQKPSLILPDEEIIQGENKIRDANIHMSDPQDENSQLTLEQIGISETNVTIDGAFNIKYEVSPTQSETENIVFQVRDTDNNITIDTVRVRPIINEAPEIGEYDPINFKEGESPYTANPINVDDDHTENMQLERIVSGFDELNVTIDPITNEPIITIPHKDWYGSETGLVTFIDKQGKSGNLNLEVNVENVNDPLEENIPIANQETNEEETLIIQNWKNYVKPDIEGSQINLVEILNLDGKATYQEVGVDLHLKTIDKDFYGPINNLILKVSDGIDETNLTPFNWNINNVNDDEEIVGMSGNLDIPEGETHIENLVQYESDIDNTSEELSWSATSSNPDITININDKVSTIETPNKDYNGPTEAIYTLSDGQGEVANFTRTVTYTPVPDKPIANDDFDETEYQETVTTPVLINDTDIENDIVPAETTVIVPASKGNTKVNPDGSIDYTPNNGHEGNDFYEYEAVDVTGLKDTAAVYILTGNNPNTAPIANNETVELDEEETVSIDILANAVDAQNNIDYGSVIIEEQPKLGTIHSIDLITGAISYTGDKDIYGLDSLKYSFKDLEGLESNVATTYLNLANVNDDEQIIGMSLNLSIPEDSLNIENLMQYERDVDLEDILTWTATSDNIFVPISIDGKTSTIIPVGDYAGPANITYTLSDGQGEAATFTRTINVLQVNDAPYVIDDTDNTAYETSVTTPVLRNDFDFELNIDRKSVLIETNANNGNLYVNPSLGTVTYTPHSGFSGVDTYQYRVFDFGGLSSVGTVTITVGEQPAIAPIANDDIVSTNYETAINNIDVAGNDFDENGNLNPLSTTITQAPSNGTLVVGADGKLGYIPNNGFTGIDIANYTIDDLTNLTSNVATLTIIVGEAQNPALNLPNYSIIQGDSKEIDADGYMSDLQDSNNQLTLEQIGTSETNVTINPTTHVIKYEVSATQTGIDEIVIQVRDTDGNTTNDIVYITPIVNNAPVASDYVLALNEDETKVGAAINVTDEHTSLANLEAVVNGFTDVYVSIDPNTKVATIYPDANINGLRTGTVTLTDEQGKYSTINMTLDIAAINDAVESTEDINHVALDIGQKVQIDLKEHFEDVETPDLIYLLNGLSLGTHTIVNGILEITATTPGSESLIVNASDEGTNINSNYFNFIVNEEPNQSPTIVDDVASADEDIAKVIYVLNNDSDDKGLIPSSVKVIEEPSHGSVNVNPSDGSITYLSGANRNEDVTFRYEVADAEGSKGTASVSVAINPTDDIPEFIGNISDKVNNEDITLVFDVGSEFNELDGEALGYNIPLPTGWSQSWNNSEVSIVAPNNYVGTITDLVAEATDPQSGVAQSNPFSITKTAVNDVVYTTGDISSMVLDKGQSTQIDLKNYFEDVETADIDLLYALAGLSLGNYSIADGILTINATTAGSESDLRVNASDEGTNVDGNYFSLIVNDVVETSNVTFNFRAASTDTDLNTGTSTLQYRLPGESWNTVTDTDGTIEVEMDAGKTYEIEIDHSNRGGNYPSFVLSGAGQTVQQDANTSYQSITIPNGSGSFSGYIIMNDFPMLQYATHAGNGGSRRVAGNMTAWDNLNYTGLNAEQKGWLSDIRSQVNSIPYMSVSLPLVESTTAPSGVYLEIKVNNNLGNATNIDGYNYITRAFASYPSSPLPDQSTFKLEIYQAIGALNDSGGDPPFFDYNGNINTTGKKCFAINYLFKPGTNF